MSKIICPNCDALTSLPWPRNEGGVFSLSKPYCPLCKEAIASDLYVTLKSEEDGPPSKSMLHEAIEEAKRTTKQRSRSGANPIPAEQDQTADLTRHSPKPKQDQTADLTGIQFVPFTPSVKLGFKDMGGIATQLNKAVSAFEAKGYEFLRIDTIHVDIRPGCIMALFGKQTEYHPYEFLVFRKIDS